MGRPKNTGLSEREEQVLELAAEGYTNRQIATELYITKNTAETHLKHIFDKLGARNRAHAVTIGFREGLLKDHRFR